jgi:hypothetical protein
MKSGAYGITLSAMIAANAALAEPVEFHRQTFSDQMTVSMVLTSQSPSLRQGYDYLVTINLIETDSSGKLKFNDGGLHKVSVKCGGAFGKVFVGGREYPIAVKAYSRNDQWKSHLWWAVCPEPPVS